MSKKKKTRRDTAEIARANLEQIIGEKLNGEPLEDDRPTPKKAGASKGGQARADKLSKTKRKQIAKKAALARWGKGRK